MTDRIDEIGSSHIFARSSSKDVRIAETGERRSSSRKRHNAILTEGPKWRGGGLERY